MNKELVGKVFGCMVLGAIITVIGVVAMVMTALNAQGRVYSLLVAVTTVVFILYIIGQMFAPQKSRLWNRALFVYFLFCTLPVAGYEISSYYHNSIPIVSEAEVDLEQYKPFRTGSKIKKLDQPATLSFQSDLPKIDGATALYPLYASFVQAVYPKKDYDLDDSEVMVSKTPNAYENLLDGKVDVIFAAAPSEEQLLAAKEKGVELKLTPIGREAFVFFVHAENSVQGLTTQQIQDIYAGDINSWDQVGGGYEFIRSFQRPENSGSQTMLKKIMGGKELMKAPQEDVVTGMGEIIEQTANYRNYSNAIGYSFLFYATEMVQNGNIRLLAIDGVKPNKETIKNRTYPFAAEFYAVTAGTDNPNAEKLIEWILSPQGQELVEKTGYIPVK
ncbi:MULTISPECIES: PstS family phosphate ABC transporter substrate-binding protein [unclassified Brevibacillus]|uniref:PstS family phosphate ABC transporter substrate-binding protein n=1 Tax=unclassified Brevibacillus TaxID=2684853 RepID=UPI003565C632